MAVTMLKTREKRKKELAACIRLVGLSGKDICNAATITPERKIATVDRVRKLFAVFVSSNRMAGIPAEPSLATLSRRSAKYDLTDAEEPQQGFPNIFMMH